MDRHCLLYASALLLAFGLAACSRETDTVRYLHYDLSLTVNPETSEIAVAGSITLPAEADTLTSFPVYLQRNMTLHQCTIAGIPIAEPDTSVSDNRFMPQARKIHIVPPKREDPDQPLQIEIAYSGRLERLPDFFVNQIGMEWTELGLYYPWFPYNGDLFPLFTFDVTVDKVSEYSVFGIGSRQDNGEKVHLYSPIPTTDIVICLSRDARLHETALENNTLRIYHHGLSDTLLAELAGEVTGLISTLSSWYGGKQTDITLISTKRLGGGGYARVGGVVLAGISDDSYFENREGYTRYFAHELAHLWWFRAQTTSWEDWLNEGLAEYSALRLMRSVYGEEVYRARLLKKKESLPGTPPILEFERNSAPYEVAYRVLYNKAPVLLDELEEKIGSDSFLNLCADLAGAPEVTTETFLAALQESAGVDTAEWFEGMLRTR